MYEFIIHFCTICGRKKNTSRWFLICENRWEDRLRVLRWDDRLARAEGVHAVCGAPHARELAVHWIKSGSLNFPFARNLERPNPGVSRFAPATLVDENLSRARQLCELYVHRESVNRILLHNPRSFAAILDELILALNPPAVSEQVQGDTSPAFTMKSTGC